jgi:hypothetical protein
MGALCGERPRLIWEHLPTIQQVEAAESQMMNGGVRFDALLKPFGFRGQ